ncbi:adaptin domain-containing protein [Natrinema marinum]|uniref:adaptin domain-containing protein n=1 Tax=Natrinema marinum TaxID=2961598 RepID=UPI0020C880A3|nr:adaptin domain-containing protein [Natrinema marinum]
MDGDRGEAVERRGGGAAGIDLPSVLAQLDSTAPTEQRSAVRRIRTVIDEQERPAACVPTVPKLRALLERPELDFHEEVAACLADLAAEAPDDVAPSADAIVAIATERTEQPVTRELLRCLAAVAAERSDAVADHTAAIADVLEQRRGYDRWGLRTLAHVSRAHPTALEPAASVLTDALVANPADNGRPALQALGRLARSDATLPSLEFVDHAAGLVDHDDAALRYDALGCLGDVADRAPAAVEPVCRDLGAALSCDDPDTRATAAITIARVAATHPTAVEPVREALFELLSDDHAHVRANACVAIGNGRVDAAAGRLADLSTADPAPNVRDRADWALEQLS